MDNVWNVSTKMIGNLILQIKDVNYRIVKNLTLVLKNVNNVMMDIKR